MATITGASLNSIYNRLNSISNYHPVETTTFNDWSIEAGDTITVTRNNNESYETPIHSTSLVWKGTPQTSVSSTGNSERDSVTKASQKKYSSGNSAMNNDQRVYKDIYSEDGYLHGQLEMTESHLRTVFEDSINGLRGEVEQTAAYWRSTYEDAYNGLRGVVEQTAEYWRSTYEDAYNGLRGVVEQTAEYWRSTYEDAYNGLRGIVEQTAEYWRSTYEDAYNGLRGVVEQTAEYWRSTYEDAYNGLRGVVEQTAEYWRSTYEDTYNGLRGYVEQTSESWRSTYEDDIGEVMTLVEQTASGWRTALSAVMDDGRVTAASIATAINSQGEAGVMLSGDWISISGSTSINDIFGVSNGYLTVAGDIYQNGTIHPTGVSIAEGGNVYFTVGTAPPVSVSLSGSDVQYMIVNAEVANGVLKLWKRGDASDSPSITFNKTTTVSGSWSGGTLTVATSPSGEAQYVRYFSIGTVTWQNDKKAAYVYVNVDKSNGGSTYTDEEDAFSLYVPTTESWNAGNMAVQISDTFTYYENPSDNPTSSSNFVYVHTTGRNTEYTQQVYLWATQDDNWSNNKKKAYINVGNSSTYKKIAYTEIDASDLVSTATTTGRTNALNSIKRISPTGTGNDGAFYNCTVYDVNSQTLKSLTGNASTSTGLYIPLTALTGNAKITANGTYTPTGTSVGFSSIEVDVAGSTQPEYFIHEEWGTGNDSNKLQIYRSTTQSGNVTSVTHTVTSSASLSYNSSTHKYTATAKGLIDGTEKYSTTFTETTPTGWNAGWAAARDSVIYTGFFPTAQPSTLTDNFYVAMPNATAGGNRVNYKYYVTSSDNYAQIRYNGNSTSNAIVAQIQHNKYTTGYRAGSQAVNLNSGTWSNGTSNTSLSNNTITVTTTGRVNSSGSANNISRAFTFGVFNKSDDNNKVEVRLNNSSSGSVLATFTHGKYTAGQRAGGNAVKLLDPTWSNGTNNTGGSSNTATVSTTGRINSSGSTANLSKSVTFGLFSYSNNVVYARLGNSSGGSVLASITHNQYTLGYSAGRGDTPVDINRNTKSGFTSGTGVNTNILQIRTNTNTSYNKYITDRDFKIYRSGNWIYVQLENESGGWTNFLTLYDAQSSSSSSSSGDTHSMTVTAQRSWYVSSATQANAQSAAATAMGVATSRLTVKTLSSSPSRWCWCKAVCGTASKYILLGF